MGSSALRVAGLAGKLKALGHGVTDCGNVAVPVAETAERGDDRAPYSLRALTVKRRLCTPRLNYGEGLPLI
jgi:hypothetical protein